MTELLEIYGNDAVLRGVAAVPWITFIDGCFMEKDILIAEYHSARTGQWARPIAPRPDITLSVYERLGRTTDLEAFALEFPHYLHLKNGVAEAYAAGIFKATKDQIFPLRRYIKVLPDVTFFIHIGNEAAEMLGSGRTMTRSNFFCEELRQAIRRIGGSLRLEECERSMRGDPGMDGIDELDIQLAKQWRGFRDGYVPWHRECRRHKLDVMKAIIVGDLQVNLN
ncbi:hypothetical protein DFH08DRAFT_817036 [Mycena albidolilacea]|uniref:Uncharacterized protein n=1 Tax=Mycena albidolilacea TaxID=1033008 RepID=A0AAD7EHP1_9AGAR|nr:hypothetical protein DFH08DRAFT_817036 [Mycena albidolilacea]